MNRTLTIYFLLILGLTVNAQTITWQKQTGPYGGSVKKLVVHPTNFTVYALAGSNGTGKLYRSSDNGVTWVEQISVAFSSDAGRMSDLQVLSNGTLLALGYNNLYKSTDDGLTWTKINTGTSSTSNGFDQGQGVAVNSFYGTGTVYVTGYDYGNSKYTLFRSTNGGATFAKGYSSASYSVTQIAITGNGDV